MIIKCIKQAKVKTENMTPIGLESIRPFKSHAQSSIKAEAVAVTVYKKDDSKTAYHNSCVVGIIKRGTNHDGS